MVIIPLLLFLYDPSVLGLLLLLLLPTTKSPPLTRTRIDTGGKLHNKAATKKVLAAAVAPPRSQVMGERRVENYLRPGCVV